MISAEQCLAKVSILLAMKVTAVFQSAKVRTRQPHNDVIGKRSMTSHPRGTESDEIPAVHCDPIYSNQLT